MRAIVLLVMVAGCNLVFDAKPTPDAAGEELERLVVPSNGVIVVSQTVLMAGVIYKLTATGTYMTSATAVGDAEYYKPTELAMPRDFDDPPMEVDIGIAIDDDMVDRNRTPRWGSFAEDHIYAIEFAGKGATIRVQLHDGVYLNNSGELELTIALRDAPSN